MKPADTTTVPPLPYLTVEDVEADAGARKVHAAEAAKAWRWIHLRLRPEMSDDEVGALVLSVLREKQPALEAEAGVVERLTAAALRQRQAASPALVKASPPKPGAVRRALSAVARIPARQIGFAALAFLALMLIIDPVMTAFVFGVIAPFAVMFAILRAFRSGGSGGGCSGGSCGV
ncbi:hypothetical protein GGE65_006618 [Skermanella aerolata]|uniref:hypothetical protein n=1 Tax=Skermanella aerolata TaxID=393310 RepID=UPI003D240638